MVEELEVRYVIESTEGTFCAYGYSVYNGVLSLTEGDGIVHTIALNKIFRVTREKVTKEDITVSVKETALV